MVRSEGNLVVAAIDLGTTHSGYAYSFRDDFLEDPLNITTNAKWIDENTNFTTFKAPTSILFDKNGTFSAFGFEAETKYSRLVDDEEDKDWRFFRQFKMSLYHEMDVEKETNLSCQQRLCRNLKLKDAHGDSMFAMDIFSAAIRFLKDHFLKVLNDSVKGTSPDDVHWILTVPVIWSNTAKQFMREAAEQAGIIKRQLTFVLAPEAAAVYCKEIKVKTTQKHGRSKVLSTFTPGEQFLLLDIGGGTVDISCHVVLDDGTLKEIHPPTGGPWGGTVVDEAYFRFLQDLVGQRAWKEFIENNPADKLELERMFEMKKRNIIKNEATLIRVGNKFLQSYEDVCKCSPAQTLSEKKTSYTATVTVRNEQVRIPNSQMMKFFEGPLNAIVIYLERTFMSKSLEHVSTIIMVGGFSELDQLKEKIKSSFPGKDVIRPSEACLAVLKGAVIYGQRASSGTYGTSTSVPYNDRIHPMKLDNVSDGKEMDNDIFEEMQAGGQPISIHNMEATEEVDESTAEYLANTCDSNRFGKLHVKIPDTSLGKAQRIVNATEDDDCNKSDEEAKKAGSSSQMVQKQMTERNETNELSGDPSHRGHQSERTEKTESWKKSKPQHTFEEISLRHATKHGNIWLLRALAAESTESGRISPLHSSISLGMKRTTSFLLQSGFDLEDSDESNPTPIQCVDQRQDSVLYECIRNMEGIDIPFSPTAPLQTNEKIVRTEPFSDEAVCIVTMERVDLCTRTVYIPSTQFRSTFMDRDQSRRMFFVSPFLSEYNMVCTYQMYGLLWLIGRYDTDGYLHCLEDILLPEKNLLHYKDGSTGVIDFLSWIRNKQEEDIDNNKESSMDQLPFSIRSPMKRTSESLCADKILCDGWTPMHYAVLTRNEELVKQLLDSGEGHLTNKTHTLLPKFILDQLKTTSVFEYEFVYSHIEGFTPLMLATFTENQKAIELIGQCIETLNIFNGKDISDCLALAYCEDTETILLDVLCRIGEKHVTQIHNVSVNLQPFYRKKNPMERILFGSSTDVIETIEEDFFAVKIIVENKTIIKEYMSPGTIDEVPEEEDELLAETIRLHSDRLWKRHSLLNAIMPGHVSSLPDKWPGYSKSVMVVFHSTDKELIPASELPFQEYLFTRGKRVLVHVTEGSFRFAPTIPTAQVGRSIDYEKFRATLGSFVESSQKQKGMLTCAHTFLRDFLDSDAVSCDRAFDLNTSPEVLRVYEVERKRLTVYKEDRTSAEENSTTKSTAGNAMDIAFPHSGSCGYVKRLLFRPDKEVGIDAALIMFDGDETFTISPHLHLEHSMAVQQKENEGVQNEDLQFYGEEFECTRSVRVLKCGIGTGLTSGVIPFVHSTGQVRVSDDSFEPMGFCNSKSKHIMKGQIVVKPLATSPTFFSQGDSGSAVFLMEKGSPLKCIGMGIGYMTKCSDVLVTPIRSILEAISEGQETTYSLLASFDDMHDAHEGDSYPDWRYSLMYRRLLTN